MTSTVLYEEYGTLCVPTHVGKKEPIVPYAHWREPGKVPDYFAYKALWQQYANTDVTVLCGTGDLYCIDVDAKHNKEACGKFVAEVTPLLSGCFIEKTLTGGTHIWFRCKDQIEGVDLAFTLGMGGSFRPIIELRGRRNLNRIFPSGGITIESGSLDDIVIWSLKQLEVVIKIAESYNQRPPTVEVKYEKKERIIGLESPGDDYSSNCDIEDFIGLFIADGWKVVKRGGSRVLLRRPGAKTLNHDADILLHKRVFKCYSPSVAQFDTTKAYSFFAVYTILRHAGSYSAAAKDLHSQSWGKSITTHTETGYYENLEEDNGEQGERDILWEKILEKKISLSKPPKSPKYTLTYTDYRAIFNQFEKDKIYGIGVGASIGLVTGPQKSRKTTIITAMIASSIVKRPVLGFYLRSPGETIWIDTEQNQWWAFQAARRVCIQANVRELPDGYHFYALKGLGGAEDKLKAVKKIVEMHPNVTCLVVDGIKDLSNDYVSDHKEASALIGYFEWVAEGRGTPCTFITVLHTNKNNGNVRGQLGSEYQNKLDWSVKVTPNDDGVTGEMTFPDVRGTQAPDAVCFEALEGNIPHLTGHPKPKYDYTIGFVEIEGEFEDDAPDNKVQVLPVISQRVDDNALDELPF